MKNKRLFKLTITAMLAALSYVMSTFVSFPYMAPFQHLFNVITGVFVGPYYALAAAFVTGCMRIALNGSTALAIIGAVFGAFLAGLFYSKSKSFLLTALGEMIGTGIISAVCAYPIMKYMFNVDLPSPVFYIPFFLPSSAMGSVLGLIILFTLRKTGTLRHLQRYFREEKQTH